MSAWTCPHCGLRTAPLQSHEGAHDCVKALKAERLKLLTVLQPFLKAAELAADPVNVRVIPDVAPWLVKLTPTHTWSPKLCVGDLRKLKEALDG